MIYRLRVAGGINTLRGGVTKDNTLRLRWFPSFFMKHSDRVVFEGLKEIKNIIVWKKFPKGMSKV